MITMTKTMVACVAAGLLALGPAGEPHVDAPRESGAYIMTIGADTFSIETFNRDAQDLKGEIVGQQLGRLRYTASLTSAALVARWELSAWTPGAPADAAPAEVIDVEFRGDSAIAHLERGGATQTQRLQTEPGALPSFPTSMALIEQIARRARALAGGREAGNALGLSDRIEIPLFLSGGQTIRASVNPLGPDSIAIVIAATEVRLRVDDEGRLLGGRIPAQNLTIHRVAREVGEAAAKGASGGEVERDYSAPPDAPYTAEEVTVPVPAAPAGKGAGKETVGREAARREPVVAHTLAGTLTLPKDRAGPVPAVVTISGSGQQHRDSDVYPGYAIFREIADALGRSGVAVLRLDDRGTGSSTGDFTTATSADFANDTRAALAYLRTRPEIDASRLVLLGHSEGGIIAPMVAASDATVAAVVLLAAQSQTGREVIASQNRFVIDADTTLKSDVARDSTLAWAVEQLEIMATNIPWLNFFLDYDPLPTAARVRQPVLILHGATDRQVTADQAERLAAAIRSGGNTHVEVQIFPELDHLFLFDPDGSPSGYATLPSKQVAPVVLATIVEWLEGVLR
jgi:pimeloyl-ACP methyl ester carboxylesterase